ASAAVASYFLPRMRFTFVGTDKMRNFIFVLGVLLCSIAPAAAQVSCGVGGPGVSIGINVPAYPQLVPVPGYPVYYAPQLNANYFFYDGLYWVYDGDNWYASEWYNGPWELVPPEAVPLFILRVPVRYYRRPPRYFHAWTASAPPRWGEHWGHTWEERRRGWDHWNRSAVPAAAPLPTYQRQYAGSRYPRVEQQQVLQSQNYRYRPHDAVAQRHYQAQQAQTPQSRVQTPQYRAEQPQNGRASSVQSGQEVPRGRGLPRQDRPVANAPSSGAQSGAVTSPGQPQQQHAREQAQQQQAQQQQRDQGPRSGREPQQEPREHQEPRQEAPQQQAQPQQPAQQQAQQQQAQQQQRAQQQAQQQQAQQQQRAQQQRAQPQAQ